MRITSAEHDLVATTCRLCCVLQFEHCGFDDPCRCVRRACARDDSMSWQPQVINTSVKLDWWTKTKLGYPCRCSVYLFRFPSTGGGADKNKTASGCLAAAQRWRPKGSITQFGLKTATATSARSTATLPQKLDACKAGSVSFVGSNIVPPMSAQLSTDGRTAVVRIVNQGYARDAELTLSGFVLSNATAVTMANDDLSAENSAASVDVAPRDLEWSGGGRQHSACETTSNSYTVVSLHER